MKAWSWSDFGLSWGGLGRSWGGLEWSWGDLWGVLGHLEAVWGVLARLGAALGGSWGLLGRSQIDQKIDLKIDPKSSWIATEKKRSGATPVVVAELYQARRDPDPIRLEIYLNRF